MCNAVFFLDNFQIKCIKKETQSILSLKQKAKYKRVFNRQAGYFVRKSENIATYAVSEVEECIKLPFML